LIKNAFKASPEIVVSQDQGRVTGVNNVRFAMVLRIIYSNQPMPGSILQGFFEMILQGVMEIGCYYVGRLVVYMISLGQWSCDGVLDDAPRRPNKKLRPYTIYYTLNGRKRFTAEATQFIGLITVALIVGLGFLIWYFGKK
jgi:hypothetical protein